MNPLVIVFLLALSLSLAILLFATRPARVSKSAQLRLVGIRGSVQLNRSGAAGLELDQTARRDFAAGLTNLLAPYPFAKRLQTLLIHSASTMTVGSVVLSCAAAAFASGLAVFLYLRILPVALAATVLGASAPYLFLLFQRAKRLKAFNDALPAAIELMARALRAGHAMGTSIELIAEQSPQPLANEFAQVFQQQKVGLQFRDALIQMGERVPSRDLQFLITAILVQKETGGDLTEILDRTSHVIRERIRIEGEVRTRTAQGRLTGWILSLLPVVMLAIINVVSPGYSTVLFHDPTGQKLLYAAAAMIVVGALIIRKVVDVQV
jgi:tight adherence protein B